MEGWGFPTPTARKVHFFRDGRSLCRHYGLLPGGESRLTEDDGNRSPDDCAACTRKLRNDKEG